MLKALFDLFSLFINSDSEDEMNDEQFTILHEDGSAFSEFKN